MNLENLEPRRLHADAKDQRFSMFDVDDSAFNSVNVNGSAACQCLDTLQGPCGIGSSVPFCLRPNMVRVRDLLLAFFLSFFGDVVTSSSMYFGL